ncbi:MAG: DUF1616 domain-containing protein, partial [Candidatus Nitrosocaldus sp.]
SIVLEYSLLLPIAFITANLTLLTTFSTSSTASSLSLAVVPLTGFLLNYSPWGIRLDPIVASMSALSITLALASVYRAYMMNSVYRRGDEEDED